jgi:hypothetical protein
MYVSRHYPLGTPASPRQFRGERGHPVGKSENARTHPGLPMMQLRIRVERMAKY